MTKIVLVAGRVRASGRTGHHDYLGGCGVLAELCNRIPGINATIVKDGWPDDPDILDAADTIVFYEGGNGKQQFLRDSARRQVLQAALDRRVGLCLFHQATVFPRDHRHLSRQWLGGAYIPKTSTRGHWHSRQREFPAHPIFTGVAPWAGRDGWMNGFCFAGRSQRITPLLYSSRRGRSGSNPASLVSWLYTRSDGGVSFAFTGLDNHRVWYRHGLRRMLVNAILWTAGSDVLQAGTYFAISRQQIKSRRSKRAPALVHFKNKAGRALTRRGRSW